MNDNELGKEIQEIVQRLTRIEVKLEEVIALKDHVDGIRQDVTELKTRDAIQQDEIEKLREQLKWIARTIIGAIIAGIIALYLK